MTGGGEEKGGRSDYLNKAGGGIQGEWQGAGVEEKSLQHSTPTPIPTLALTWPVEHSHKQGNIITTGPQKLKVKHLPD